MSKKKTQVDEKQEVVVELTDDNVMIPATQQTVQAVQPESKQVVKARRSSYPFGDLVATAATTAKIPRSYAHACIKAFLNEAKSKISEGHSVNFSQFGSFDARMIHAKEITTPQGKKVQTVDRVRVRFHNSTRLNELMDAVGVKALEKQGFSQVWKPPVMPNENGKVKENQADSIEAELDQVLETDFDV